MRFQLVLRGILSGLLFLTIINSYSLAEDLSQFTMGIRSRAMGSSASTSYSNIWGCSLNPANAAYAQKHSIAGFVNGAPSLTDNYGVGVTLVTSRIGTFGFGYYRTNSETIGCDMAGTLCFTHELGYDQFLLTHARTLFKGMSVGVNVEYLFRELWAVENPAEYLCIDIAFQYHVNSGNMWLHDVSLGLVMDNLLQPVSPGRTGQELFGYPADEILRGYRFIVEKELAFGAHVFHLTGNMLLTDEYVFPNEYLYEWKKQTSKPKFMAGLEYMWHFFIVRAGSYDSRFTGGLGIFHGYIHVDYAHASPQIGGYNANSFSLGVEF